MSATGPLDNENDRYPNRWKSASVNRRAAAASSTPSLSDADDDAAAARPSSLSDGIDEISEPSDENDAESCVSSLEDSEVSIAGQKPNNSLGTQF